MDRRRFLTSTAAGLALTKGLVSCSGAAEAAAREPLGEGRGIHPGRVVWVHDPKVTDWKSPEAGHWWEADHLSQDRVNTMMERAVCGLTGEKTALQSWDKLFRHFNQVRGKAGAGYQAGEKVVIKPNWVGMIWREGHVDLKTRNFKDRQDYMNTAPQMIVALIAQLKAAGVSSAEITICDTLACITNEFHGLIHAVFPEVRFVDFQGGAGRDKAENSKLPLYWSPRAEVATVDTLPTCYAEAAYIVNFANLKAHTGAGVTLCGKNHFGSLIRTPVQKGYFDIHPGSFSKQTGIYRPQVDLLGHAHLGGKTVLNLIDGIFSGVHPKDPLPQRMKLEPFDGHWSCSLFASQDPVAIDSVAFDFLHAGFEGFPRQTGVDDYLHEAALAHNPPSGTFYDPNHAVPTTRLASLGAHEHWNNPQEKKYSRNLGLDKGIELVALA